MLCLCYVHQRALNKPLPAEKNSSDFLLWAFASASRHSPTTTRELNDTLVFIYSPRCRDEGIHENTTLSFLITLDKDLGELMMLKLSWEVSDMWKNVWTRMQSIFPWGGQESKPQMMLGKISVKAGETQDRYSARY